MNFCAFLIFTFEENSLPRTAYTQPRRGTCDVGFVHILSCDKTDNFESCIPRQNCYITRTVDCLKRVGMFGALVVCDTCGTVYNLVPYGWLCDGSHAPLLTWHNWALYFVTKLWQCWKRVCCEKIMTYMKKFEVWRYIMCDLGFQCVTKLGQNWVLVFGPRRWQV